MIADPFFYWCAIPAVLIIGMAKGGFGGGIAVISVPLMSLAVAPTQAVAILLPLLIVMDVTAVWSFRGQWSKINLLYTLPGAIFGVLVGTLTFHFFSEDAIRLLIGVVALIFCLNYWLQPTSRKPKQPNCWRGNFWGSIAGFTSFGIHAGGPPISVYLLPQNMEKRLLMGTFAIFFCIVNWIKLIPYTWLGMIDTGNVMTSLALIPIAPIGVRLGYYLLHKINEATIYRICYFFLSLMALKLLWEGVRGLMS